MNTLRSIGIVSASSGQRFATARQRLPIPPGRRRTPEVHRVVLTPGMTPDAKADRVMARLRQVVGRKPRGPL